MEKNSKVLYGEKRNHFEVILKVDKFSEALQFTELINSMALLHSNIKVDHSPFEFFITIYYMNAQKKDIRLPVWAAGCDIDRLCFSIELDFDKEYLTEIYNFRIVCHVSVIDVAGKKRFVQTFVKDVNGRNHVTFLDDTWFYDDARIPLLDVDDYLPLQTLLSDSSEYLPDDCLTLQFEVIFMNKYCEESFIIDDISVLDEMVASSLIVEESNTSFNNEQRKLRLNSEVGKCMRKTSSVFRDMFDLTTADDTTEYLQISIKEINGFTQIFRIINAAAEIRVRGITDICEIYTTADKYDVPLAIEACRDFFRSFLCMKNSPGGTRSYLPEILELAENFNDEILKQIVEDFNKREENPMEEDGDLNLKWILEESSFTYEYRLIRSDQSRANGREEFNFYQ